MADYRIYEGEQGGDCIYLVDARAHALELTKALAGCPATVVQLFNADWARDLPPWPGAGLREREDFSGGGPATLKRLTERDIPAIEAENGLRPARRCLAGYSLAGLFALYAVTRSDFFAAAASASGSLWYEGWVDYLAAAPVYAQQVYLSLGDRERFTRSPRMARVEDCTRRTLALLEHKGVKVRLQMHPGGHFKDPAGRLAAACRALALG